ncbi:MULTISPECIES: hypothetical protein [unclassified Lentimonas]|uniref:hypothetical protein n=1 Tax=unclassified Lentimonas TaxID=2630993 RepID=UPI0013231879|nr:MULTISPECIES: hypothetical protein [unclassified Lentimonas]CAA6692495.1 Unannotated [Lentimonas sp. CC19]CAA6696826.1 Unannotated [Lentimonas sp. CC10]CAA7070757.1 Unannotated [Lentimonas sp. CC11]
MNKNSINTVRAALCLLSLTTGAHAATITWGPALDIAGDTDISTDGSSVVAASFDRAAKNISVNGVTFKGGGSTSNIRNSKTYETALSYTMDSDAPAAFKAPGGTFETLSADYQNLLDSGVFVTPGRVELILGDLKVAEKYQVQLWANDPRGTATSTIEVGSTTLEFKAKGQTGNAGQYVIGTFIADATDQVIAVTSSGDPLAWQVNALQVRWIPEFSKSVLFAGCFALSAVITRRRKSSPTLNHVNA